VSLFPGFWTKVGLVPEVESIFIVVRILTSTVLCHVSIEYQ
jgi:hypothetical protein